LLLPQTTLKCNGAFGNGGVHLYVKCLVKFIMSQHCILESPRTTSSTTYSSRILWIKYSGRQI